MVLITLQNNYLVSPPTLHAESERARLTWEFPKIVDPNIVP